MRNFQEDIELHTIQFYADDRPKSKMGRPREVKSFEAGAIQDFGDLLKAF